MAAAGAPPPGARGGDAALATEATFALAGEDHTLGNAVRYMLNKHPGVVFAGYSVPHPSDDLVHVRVQTAGGLSATQALRDAVTGALRRGRAAQLGLRRRPPAQTLAPAVAGARARGAAR
jgi:DNA-directed RNA polymerase subunit L